MNTKKLNTLSLLVVVAGFLYVTSGVMEAYGWRGLFGTLLSLLVAMGAVVIWSRLRGVRS